MKPILLLCRCIIALSMLAVLLLTGACSKYGKLLGKVTYKGQAVPRAQIVFLWENGQLRDATADDKGNYSLSNVPLGRARIGVKNLAQGMADMQANMMAKFGKKAKDALSNLQGSVEPVSKQTDGSGKFIPLPEKAMDPEKSGLIVDVSGGTQEFNIEVVD